MGDVQEVAPQRQTGRRVGHGEGAQHAPRGHIDLGHGVVPLQGHVQRRPVGHHAPRPQPHPDRIDQGEGVQVDQADRARRAGSNRHPRLVGGNGQGARIVADRDLHPDLLAGQIHDRRRATEGVGRHRVTLVADQGDQCVAGDARHVGIGQRVEGAGRRREARLRPRRKPRQEQQHRQQNAAGQQGGQQPSSPGHGVDSSATGQPA